MKIGELATRTNTQIETIRYYEREGLLAAPGRSEGNYRIYGEAYGLATVSWTDGRLTPRRVQRPRD